MININNTTEMCVYLINTNKEIKYSRTVERLHKISFFYIVHSSRSLAFGQAAGRPPT